MDFGHGNKGPTKRVTHQQGLRAFFFFFQHKMGSNGVKVNSFPSFS